MPVATFRYDFSSPYSYFAAHRVDGLLSEPVRWQPVLFGALAQSIGKVPWSLQPGEARDHRMRECEARAAELGLPLTWPRDWPLGTYSVIAVLAALVAEDSGLQRPLALELFRQGLGLGRDLADPAVVHEAAEAVGIEADVLAERVQQPELKARLRAATVEAEALGITGIPTLTLASGEHFWGEDRLDEAAAAARRLPTSGPPGSVDD